jgi:hypothetical protein
MLRLIKLAIYALAGYAIYEFVQGLLESNPKAPAKRTTLESGTRG